MCAVTKRILNKIMKMWKLSVALGEKYKTHDVYIQYIHTILIIIDE